MGHNNTQQCLPPKSGSFGFYILTTCSLFSLGRTVHTCRYVCMYVCGGVFSFPRHLLDLLVTVIYSKGLSPIPWTYSYHKGCVAEAATMNPPLPQPSHPKS